MLDLIMASPFLSGLVNHLWQTTVFVGVVALVVFAMRRNHARLRHAMWFVASVKFLVPFSLLVAIGNAIEWPAAAPTFNPGPNIVVFARVIPPPVAETFPTNSLVFLAGFAAAAWLAGFVLVTLAWYRAWLRADRAVKSAEPISEAMPESLKGAGSIQVRFSTGVKAPGVFGFFRPLLLLPADIGDRLAPDELAAVVAHELAHVRRRDNLTTAFHTFVTAVFWFHPFVWWVGKQLITERERACDEAAVAGGFAPKGFAEALLKVCRSAVGGPLECVAGIYGSNLKTRIEGIMNFPKAQKLGLVLRVTIGMLAIVVVLGPVAIGLSRPAPERIELSAPQEIAGEEAEETEQVEAEEAEREIRRNRALERWVQEDVTYIMEEIEREAFDSLDTEEEREMFIEQFWLRRDPTPGTAENEYREEHYRRIAQANEQFAYDGTSGWRTDRGMILILYGPARRNIFRVRTFDNPVERWTYRFIEGLGENVTFEFIDPDGTGEYRLERAPSQIEDLADGNGDAQ